MKSTFTLVTAFAALLTFATSVIALPLAQNGGPSVFLYRRVLEDHLRHAAIHVQSENKKGHGEHATFSGHIAAHTENAMTPALLREYAEHAHHHIHNQNPKLHHAIVVAATHRPGDNHVTIHTAPRGESYYQHQHKNFDNMRHEMQHAGLTTINSKTGNHELWHHAETAAVKKSMQLRGADNSNAVAAAAGHVVGVYGHVEGKAGKHVQVSRPCDKCQDVLTAMGVHH